MTSLLPRKPRTTAPRTRAARTACRLAALLLLAGGTAAAQNAARPAARPVGYQKPADPVTGQDPNDKRTPAQKLEDDDRKARVDYIRLPPREDVFAFPNDQELEQAILRRLRDEMVAKKQDPTTKYGPDVRFPRNEPVGGSVAYAPKTPTYPPTRVNYEPLFVVHRRLHFEELNAERYGWDFGIIQPFVSTAHFYKSVLLWPNSLASGCAYGFWDTNAGKCLPGSPTPYMLYPPGLTLTGTTFEAAVITGAAFAIP